LFDYTKLGGKAVLAVQGIEYNSGMPGFGEQLDDGEIWNIIAFIKSTWPERIGEAQAQRTAVDISATAD
jgi:mono/diheme cytochrome c family protein